MNRRGFLSRLVGVGAAGACVTAAGPADERAVVFEHVSCPRCYRELLWPGGLAIRVPTMAECGCGWRGVVKFYREQA